MLMQDPPGAPLAPRHAARLELRPARAHRASEIAYAQEIFRKHPNWPVIDVTGKAIEETAADILRIQKQRMGGGQ